MLATGSGPVRGLLPPAAGVAALCSATSVRRSVHGTVGGHIDVGDEEFDVLEQTSSVGHQQLLRLRVSLMEL